MGAALRLSAALRLVAAARVAAVALVVACGRPAPERDESPAGSVAEATEHALHAGVTPSGVAPAIATPPRLPDERRPDAATGAARPGDAPREDAPAIAVAPSAAREGDASIVRALQRAPLRALKRVGKPAEARFEATLSLGAAAPGERPREVRVTLAPALKLDPLAYQRPLAFYRLARALGARVVPAAAARRIGIGELSTLLEREPGARKLLRRFAVMNDGAVDALVTARAAGPPGAAARARTIRFDDAPELKRWARWARAPSAARGERTAILRDYLEMLALDYLAGNGLRQEIVVHAGGLSLEANAGAFPPHVKANELDRQIKRLVDAARFPRALRDAIARFGPAEAARALRPGGFEGALVPPRALVELEERRSALLSLIEAKIAARGEDAVLSL